MRRAAAPSARPSAPGRGPDAQVAAMIDATGPGRSDEEGRSARKRRTIMEAATTLFLRNGYQGTSMDEIAAAAAVSKQTVYKNFADKEQLFSEIVLGVTVQADEFIATVIPTLQDTDDVEQALDALARRYIAAVMLPR